MIFVWNNAGKGALEARKKWDLTSPNYEGFYAVRKSKMIKAENSIKYQITYIYEHWL